MLRINNLKLNLDDAIDYASELANLRKLVIFKYKIEQKNILLLKINKKAIDARRKDKINLVYSVDLELAKNEMSYHKKFKDVLIIKEKTYTIPPKGNKDIFNPPVIVGFGPSGIFAALLLSRSGYNPIVLERGLDVANRTKEWNEFITNSIFNKHASVQFGEGGAGTFSDGKLTTLINDDRCKFVLEELVKAGAHPEIQYLKRPHIGTDELKKVIKNIREEIIKNGGVVKFDSQVTDFIIEDQKLKAVVVNHSEKIPTEICLLGIGHSARDTFELLFDKSLSLTPKPFSMGVRIEHPQILINKAQYGKFYDHPALKAADYKLSYHSDSKRTSYTFCMCPGGYVVQAASEPETIVTNGMSYSKRDGENANAAVLVNITPKDFPSGHPLSGMYFQRDIERKAYKLTKSYNAPIQLVGDFLDDKLSTKLESTVPTIKPGYTFVEIKRLFPDFITETLKESILYFDKKIKGFARHDAILTAPETRSSSPIRMNRDTTHQSNIEGIYPMGEGAGYAGGIMSSAVDGMKTAEMIIKQFIF